MLAARIRLVPPVAFVPLSLRQAMTSSAAIGRHAEPYVAFAQERQVQDEMIGCVDG